MTEVEQPADPAGPLPESLPGPPPAATAGADPRDGSGGAGPGEGPWRQPTLSAEVRDVAGPEPGFWPEPEDGLAGPALRAALEAILLVVDEPVTEQALAQTVEQPTDRVSGALADLAAEYTEAGRGIDLRRVAGGWRLYTRAEQAPYVQRFVLDGQQTRLTQAALETLAVVAYRQPVTRSGVAAVRGVNCDGVFRTLLTRGLVEEAGTEPESGAHLYRTTSVFLEKLGLDSLDELPPLAPFLPDDLAGFDPDAPEPGLTSATAVAAQPDGSAGEAAAEPAGGPAAEPEQTGEPAAEPGAPEPAQPAAESVESVESGAAEQVGEPAAPEPWTTGTGSVPVERRNDGGSFRGADDGFR